MASTVSIIVMADNHRNELEACLDHIDRLDRSPDEVLVVGVDYASRQAAIEAASGEIIAFIEAVCHVRRDWLDQLLVPYQDQTVVGVGARVLFGDDDGSGQNVAEVGCLLPNGSLTTNFGADPGRMVEVAHLASAGASFRRTALQALEAIPARFPGRSDRDVTEISLRLQEAGAKLIFQPTAVVRAPALGHLVSAGRVDYRRGYYYHRDLLVVLTGVYGWRSPLLPRSVWTTVRRQPDHVRIFIRNMGPRSRDGRVRSPGQRLSASAELAWIPVNISALVVGLLAAATQSQQMPRSSPRRRRASPQRSVRRTLSRRAPGAVRSAHHR